MKKRFVITLSTILATGVIAGLGWLITDLRVEKASIQPQDKTNDFQKFVLEIFQIGSTLDENFELVKQNQRTAIEIFRNNHELNSRFQVDALKCIKKTQLALQDFKNTALRFKESKNSNVSEIANQCLIYYEYGNEMLEHYWKFISQPPEYTSSDTEAYELTAYTKLFKKQGEHLIVLMEKAGKTESLASEKKAVVQLQYPNEESKAMEKWTGDNVTPLDFELTDAEKADIEKFIESSKTSGEFTMMTVLNAAYEGNPIAMYMAGQSHISGVGATINQEAANLYYKNAASLGYSPALYEISRMYINDHQDLMLYFVYLNLTISFGHREYRDFYYSQIKLLSKITGPKVIQEIERIALEKSTQILQLQEEIKNNEGTYLPGIELIGNNIVSMDTFYDKEYWKQFFQSDEKWKKFYINDKD